MSSLDPDLTLHDAPCLECGARLRVPLSRTRLEQRPWRLGWRCLACGRDTLFPAPPDLIGPMLDMQRAGGVAVSKREVQDFVRMSDEELDRRLRDELP